MNILSVIPARGGSKGVPGKNIMDILGKPLIAYTLEEAAASRLVDRIVVSTDSEKIAAVVKSLNVGQVIMRPAEFAQDDSPIEEALLHAVEHLERTEGYRADIVVWMQPNVPIREPGIVDRVVGKLVESDADSCVTCREATEFPEAMKIINEKGRLVPIIDDVKGIRRQEFPHRFLLDGSVVVIKADNLYKSRGIRKGHVYLGDEVIPVFQTRRMYSLEIDEPEDVELITFCMTKALKEDN